MKTFQQFLDEDFNIIFDMIAEDGETDLKQPWKDYQSKDIEPFKDNYFSNIEPHLDKTEEPFRKLLRDMKVDGAKSTVARKSLESLHDKVMNREKPLSTVHDVLRGAILTRNKDDAKSVVDKLKDSANVVSHEYKKIGEYDTGYGGAHHVVLDINGVKTEVQVMPKKIWKAHHESHRIYRKYRSMENPESHPDYAEDHKNTRKLFKRAHKAWVRDN